MRLKRVWGKEDTERIFFREGQTERLNRCAIETAGGVKKARKKGEGDKSGKQTGIVKKEEDQK